MPLDAACWTPLEATTDDDDEYDEEEEEDDDAGSATAAFAKIAAIAKKMTKAIL